MKKSKIKIIFFGIDDSDTKILGNQIPFKPSGVINRQHSHKRIFQGQHQMVIAIKAMKNCTQQQGQMTICQKDVLISKILMRDPCAHIVTIYKIQEVRDKDRLIKAFIFMQRGKQTLNRSVQEPINLKLKYIGQIIKGLFHLHSRMIVHRDLKIENVMVQKSQVKLIDFGSSKFYGSMKEGQYFEHEILKINSKDIKATMSLGTQYINPPQMIIEGIRYKSIGACDMWQLAILIIQFIWLDYSVDTKQCFEDYYFTKDQWAQNPKANHKYTYKPKRYVEFENQNKLLQLVNRCIYYNADRRITSQQMMKEYYTEVYTDKYKKMESENTIIQTKSSFESPVQTPDRPQDTLNTFITYCCQSLKRDSTKLEQLKDQAGNLYGEKGIQLVITMNAIIKDIKL